MMINPVIKMLVNIITMIILIISPMIMMIIRGVVLMIRDHPNGRRMFGSGGGFHKLNYSDRRRFWLNVIWPNLPTDGWPFRHISHESGDSRNLIGKKAEVEHLVDLTSSPKSISGLVIRVVDNGGKIGGDGSVSKSTFSNLPHGF